MAVIVLQLPYLHVWNRRDTNVISQADCNALVSREEWSVLYASVLAWHWDGRVGRPLPCSLRLGWLLSQLATLALQERWTVMFLLCYVCAALGLLEGNWEVEVFW